MGVVIKPATVALCVLASAIAVLVETIAFWFTGYDLGLAVVSRHLLLVLLVGLLTGVLASLRQSETVAARLWMAGPSLIAISPLLARTLGTWAILFSVVLLILWSLHTQARQSESVLVASVAGSILAVRLALFLLRDYAGRDTAWGPLVVLTLTLIISSYVYASFSGSRYRQASSNTRQLSYGVAIAIASVLTLVAFTGSSLPNDLGSRDSSAGGAPPIVLIVLDTVRADHLELYGYERRTMPGLAAFAREVAVVVERAITNAPDSLAAHASLFTGLFPANHGAHRPLLNDPSPPRFGYPLRPDVPTIATVLSDNGYATVGVVGNFGPIGSAEMGLSRGFVIYRANRDGDCANQRRSPWSPLARVVNVLKASCVEYRRAEHITNEAITALELLKESDFFLFVNYMDAHSPYDPPAPFRSTFGSVAVGRETLNLYNGELSYLDTHLKRLLDHLREHPAWDDMVVVITSDHGESFGEHGLLGHTTSLYDEMIRVPLVLRFGRINSVAEGMSPGSRWRQPHAVG